MACTTLAAAPSDTQLLLGLLRVLGLLLQMLVPLQCPLQNQSLLQNLHQSRFQHSL
jgi:hypothetical protein